MISASLILRFFSFFCYASLDFFLSWGQLEVAYEAWTLNLRILVLVSPAMLPLLLNQLLIQLYLSYLSSIKSGDVLLQDPAEVSLSFPEEILVGFLVIFIDKLHVIFWVDVAASET